MYITSFIPTISIQGSETSYKQPMLNEQLRINFVNRKVCVDALRNQEHQNYSKLTREEKDFYKALRKVSSRKVESEETTISSV